MSEPSEYPIYCINLARRPDRWARMQRIAAAAGIALIRVDAIDAQSMPAQPGGVISPGPVTGLDILDGDLACSLSHRKAWSMMLEAGHPSALILEDDCVFSDGMAEVMPPDWMPETALVVKLETVLRPTRLSRPLPARIGDRHLARIKKRHTGTAAYVLTANAARILVEHTKVFRDPVDQVIFNPLSALFSRLAPLQMVPAPVIQGELVAHDQDAHWAQSSIQDNRDRDWPDLKDAPAPRILGGDQAADDTPESLRRQLRRRLQRMLGLEKHSVPFG